MALLDFRSERLRAVAVSTLDADDRRALLAPEVVRWLPLVFQNLESDKDRLTLLEGLALEAETAALTDEVGQNIGLIFLSHPMTDGAADGVPVRHLGYLFAENAWGRGYATEMLSGLQALFRGQRVRISGGVMQENAASARVLLKAGFREGARNGEGEATYIWDAMG